MAFKSSNIITAEDLLPAVPVHQLGHTNLICCLAFSSPVRLHLCDRNKHKNKFRLAYPNILVNSPQVRSGQVWGQAPGRRFAASTFAFHTPADLLAHDRAAARPVTLTLTRFSSSCSSHHLRGRSIRRFHPLRSPAHKILFVESEGGNRITWPKDRYCRSRIWQVTQLIPNNSSTLWFNTWSCHRVTSAQFK